MNLFDENIPEEQIAALRAGGIRCRVIGQDIAELSIGDDNIVALLHHLKHPTFFTRDEHFFARHLCHANYCLVWLDAAPAEAAFFTRRFLNHSHFLTKADRAGIVARVHHDGIHFWQQGAARLQNVRWTDVS